MWPRERQDDQLRVVPLQAARGSDDVGDVVVKRRYGLGLGDDFADPMEIRVVVDQVVVAGIDVGISKLQHLGGGSPRAVRGA